MSKPTPIIDTSHGQVRGHILKTCYEDEYYCFDGIPYAKPPLGELRFRAPVEGEPWLGVRDCTKIPNKCTQYNKYTKQLEGSEDCLYLNINCKKLNSEKKLPVMVYIHGGGFASGTPKAWGPEYFMMKDVILVTIGYRFGALGLLKFKDPSLRIPGNATIRDIILALKWIMKNIENFNGDSNNITLFGHSSGSVIAQMLLLTEKAKGLFHKAILMSGFQLRINEVPDMEYRLATRLGYTGSKDDNEIYKFLLNIEAEKFCIQNFWTPEELQQGFVNDFIFSLSIEAYESEDSILIDNPLNLMENSWSLKSIPILMGCNADEACYFQKMFKDNTNVYEMYKNRPELLLPREFSCLVPDLETQRSLAARLIDVHYAPKPFTLENFDSLIDLFGYNFMYHGTSRFARSRLLALKAAPTYLYHFNIDSDTFNFYRLRILGKEIRGVGHVAELPYLFWISDSFKLDRNSQEFKTICLMTEVWTHFAATSNPNAACIKHMKWEPLNNANLDDFKCLNISNEVNVTDWPYSRKCESRDAIFRELGYKLF